MISDTILYAGVVIYWSAFVLVFRKRISVIPIVPFIPIVLLALGVAMNHWIWIWCGTIVVMIAQAIPLMIVIWWAKRKSN